MDYEFLKNILALPRMILVGLDYQCILGNVILIPSLVKFLADNTFTQEPY